MVQKGKNHHLRILTQFCVLWCKIVSISHFLKISILRKGVEGGTDAKQTILFRCACDQMKLKGLGFTSQLCDAVEDPM